MAVTYLDIDSDIKKRLQKIASENERTLSGQISFILKKYLQKNPIDKESVPTPKIPAGA